MLGRLDYPVQCSLPRPLQYLPALMAQSFTAWPKQRLILPCKRISAGYRTYFSVRTRCFAPSDLQTLPPEAKHGSSTMAAAVERGQLLAGQLPIAEVLHEVVQALAVHSSLVLQAPPGAGKTTIVPLVASSTCPSHQRLVVVVPRRIAAKAAARRMAALTGTRVGREVGYQVRLDSRVSAQTRVVVVTPGVLLKQLQEENSLASVGGIIFDEFHERGAETDLGLSLALDAQRHDYPDLRLLVMSATWGDGLAERLADFLMPLSTVPVTRLLANASTSASSAGDALRESKQDESPTQGAHVPVIVSQGKSYPVDVIYVGSPQGMDSRALAPAVASAIQQALSEHKSGDMLVFLPGMREMRAVQQTLDARRVGSNAMVSLLHGDLSMADQDALLAPAPQGRRRIILATSIAESSITLPGVVVVIDAGFARQPAFDARAGLWRLETVPVSLASADQRAGRAGRTAPGTCYRMWSQQQHAKLLSSPAPGIQLEDLAPLALHLACLGGVRAERLSWLDPPNAHTLASARTLLAGLGAVDEQGDATELGRRLGELSVHPRLGAMLLTSLHLNAPHLGCLLASLLSERDAFRDRAPSPDLSLRVFGLADALAGAGKANAAEQAILASSQQLLSQLQSLDDPASRGVNASPESGVGSMLTEAVDQMQGNPDLLGVLVAVAYPDRLALKRESSNRGRPSTYLMANGASARLPDVGDPLGDYTLLAVAHVGGHTQRGPRNDTVYLAAGLSPAAVQQHLSHLVSAEDSTTWNAGTKTVERRIKKRIGSLTLSDDPGAVSDEDAVPIIVSMIRKSGLPCLPLPKPASALLNRARWLAHTRTQQTGATHARTQQGGAEEWPDLSDDALLASLDQWLGPALARARSRDDLARLDWNAIVRGLMTKQQLRAVEAHAPERWKSPFSNASFSIDYTSTTALLAAPISAFFGPVDTLSSTLPGGTVLVLLSPRSSELARVPSTQLAGFWQATYPRVRSELVRRYPKHKWPTDPLDLNSAATAIIKAQQQGAKRKR